MKQIKKLNKDEIFEKEATYVSPITVELHKIQREYNRKLDTLILNEIRKYDVKVDKDELVKALKYDRNQYEKGFADGKKEAAEKILQEVVNAWNTGNLNQRELAYICTKNGIELGENL